MRVFPLLLALFIGIPILEVYLLIEIGGVIGALPTIALVVLTAVLGAGLLRMQGLSTLRRAEASLNRGGLPAFELAEGVALLIGGALLLTPGFVTDALGFMCLLPPSRRVIIATVLARIQVLHGGPSGARAGQGEPPPREARDAQRRGRVIEGEFKDGD